MSIRDQLETNLRNRVQRNLEASRGVLVQLITAPINDVSGVLRAGVSVDTWSQNGDTYLTTARSIAPYSLWIDSGTGIYGPGGRGSPITPTTKPLLKFFWQKRGAWYSMKSVRGTPALQFFSAPMAANLSTALQQVWGP